MNDKKETNERIRGEWFKKGMIEYQEGGNSSWQWNLKGYYRDGFAQSEAFFICILRKTLIIYYNV